MGGERCKKNCRRRERKTGEKSSGDSIVHARAQPEGYVYPTAKVRLHVLPRAVRHAREDVLLAVSHRQPLSRNWSELRDANRTARWTGSLTDTSDAARPFRTNSNGGQIQITQRVPKDRTCDHCCTHHRQPPTSRTFSTTSAASSTPTVPPPITRTLSLSSSCLAHPLSTEARVAITCRSGHTTYVSRRSSSFPNAHIPFATLCHCRTCMLRTAFASLNGWLYVEPVAITRTSYGTGSHQFSTVKCVSLTDDTTPRIHLHPGRYSLWRTWIECACSGSTIHRRMLGVNSKKWHCHLHQKGKERSARATGCASE